MKTYAKCLKLIKNKNNKKQTRNRIRVLLGLLEAVSVDHPPFN